MNVPVHLRPDETFVLNLGPQHPATHGVLRVKLTMDGEYIVHAEPVLGYIHRMHEKMGEVKSYAQYLPNMGRVDYLHALAWNWAFVGAVADNTFTDTGLSAGTAYYYRVSSRDAAGNVSLPCEPHGVVTRGAPLTTRIENTNAAISYVGTWNLGTTAYSGSSGGSVNWTQTSSGSPTRPTCNAPPCPNTALLLKKTAVIACATSRSVRRSWSLFSTVDAIGARDMLLSPVGGFVTMIETVKQILTRARGAGRPNC